MTITYEYEGALYVNLTNRCNCNCEFCLRHGKKEGSIYTEDSLWLEREPTRREALDIAIPSLKAVLAACDEAGYGHIALCPETMGKINQLGDLDEVLELCTLDERLLPCIDFGHLYARSLGADDGPEVFERMLDRVEEVLKAQGEELSRQAGGVSPFLTAFFSGRRLTQKEAEELKQLIDQHTWEG